MASSQSVLAPQPEQPAWEQVISDINSEFGFHIIIGPSRPKPPSHLSREERCGSLLRALWRANETAVYHCCERLRDCWRLDRDRDCASLLGSFVRFLELEIVEERRRSPTARLTQSFHVAPPQSTDEDLGNRKTTVHEGNGGCTPETAVANSQHDEVSGQAILPQGSLEHWHSYTLPSAGLFAPDLDVCPSLRQAPFAVQYECTRFALACGVTLSDIDVLYSKAVAAQPRKLRRSNSGAPVSNSAWQDYPTLRKHLTSLITNPGFVFLSPSEHAWAAALAGSPNLHMSADIRFETDKEKAIFKLQLAPFHIEQKSRRLLRKFGASRFLFVKIPAFRSPPSHLSHGKDLLETRIIEWLGSSRPKPLAGNSWKFLSLKLSKDKRRKRARKDDDHHHSKTFEAIFFAVDGPGLEPISIDQLVSWFMPLERNVGLTFAKAYARLELGFSTTFPTLQFMPGQVHYVDDIFADDAPEETQFNDPRFSFPETFDAYRPRVMNDGCSRISWIAAQKAWSLMEDSKKIPLPCAFQARIGPAKGVWMVEARDHDDNRKYCDIWIEITTSQKKSNPHLDDLSPEVQYDSHRLTFEINNWTQCTGPSKLYKEFCPIMEDRGVPRDAIVGCVIQSLQSKSEPIESAVEDKLQLYRWLEQEYGSVTLDQTKEWPDYPSDRLRIMILSGFELRSSTYMSNLFSRMIAENLSRTCVEFNHRCVQSTFVLGVADPCKCLAPGEVHLYFSDGAILPDGSRRPVLNDVEALVARNPALRPSDMQKIRIVFKPQLAHLIDVVVFPTRGSVPLASKLQGGDYDGDKFWACWEPDLVCDFRNAPAPISEPDPAKLGVKQDRRSLGEVLVAGGVSRFLMEGAALQMKEQFLGIVTNEHMQMLYHQRSLESPFVSILADLHDVLIDSSKNGYIFEKPAWDLFRASHFPFQKELTLAKPAWKLAAERDAYLICDSNSEFPKYNTENILDHLIFNIAGPSSRDIHRRLCNNMSCDSSEKDKDLEEYFYQFITSTKECAILNEFAENLNHDLNQILKTHWQPSLCLTASTLELKKDRFADQCVKFRKVFSDIQPRCTLTENHRVAQGIVKGMTACLKSTEPNRWDQIKASALWCNPNRKRSLDVFEIAGKVLCYIKAHSVGYTTVSDGKIEYRMPVYVVPAVMSQMKMRKAKRKATMPLWDTDGDIATNSDDVLLEEEEMEVDDIAESSLHGQEFLRRSNANAHSLMNSVLPRRLSGRVAGAGNLPLMAPPGTNPAMRSQIDPRDEVIDQLSQIFGSRI